MPELGVWIRTYFCGGSSARLPSTSNAHKMHSHPEIIIHAASQLQQMDQITRKLITMHKIGQNTKKSTGDLKRLAGKSLLNASLKNFQIIIMIIIWLNEQMVYARPRICPGEWDAQTPLRFWDTNGSSNLGQTARPSQQKKRIFRIVDFAVPVDHWVKMKESEKKDKYLDIARELKKTVE